LDEAGFVKLSMEGAEKSIERHDRIDGQSKIARMPDGCPRILGAIWLKYSSDSPGACTPAVPQRPCWPK
jgi:hypothetical protein